MLLAEKYCSITTDNELIIDYRPELAYCIKISPWSQGLQLKLLQGNDWADSYHEPNIPLLTCATIEDPNPIIAGFMRDMPSEVKTKLERYRYLQFSLLRLIASSQAAFEIFADNPNLLWLFAYYYRYENIFAEDVLLQLNLKRKDILGKIELPGSKSSFKLLAKIDILHGSLEELLYIIWTLRSHETLGRLAHFPRIPIGILKVIKIIPNIVDSSLFSQYTKTDSNKNKLPMNENDAKQLGRTWDDIKRLSYALGYGDATPVLTKIQTIDEIWRLHDRWTERYNELQEQAFVEVQFSEPPIPGNNWIVPIINSKQLLLEGKLMSHCVGTYAEEVLAGHSYIYQVLKPERATLELGLDTDEIYIRQCKLYKNATPSQETILAIKSWITEFRHLH